MVQYQYILPTVKQIQTLAQLQKTADEVLSSRIDIQVKASTDSDADYAAEVADGRAWGETHGSLGTNIRDGQLRLSLALSSEEVHRLADNASLQGQINSLSEAVLEILAIISENREELGGNK